MTPPDPDAVTGGHAGGEHGSDGHGDGVHRGRSAGGSHSPLFRAVVAALAILLFLAFVALGTWQVKRRVWKLDLIARVEQRVHAPPVAAPGPAQWPQVSASTDEYRHVTVTGTFLDEAQTLVQAVTELGAGYWVLTPLRAMDGSIVLVNRGFVLADDRDRVAAAGAQPPGATPRRRQNAGQGGGALNRSGYSRPSATADGGAGKDGASGRTDMPAPTTVIGLLRISESRGAFLRHNDAATNHWYSRDVQAIAAARGLTHVAPYFIDAEAARPSAASGVASVPSPTPAASATSATGAASATGATPATSATPAASALVVPVAGLTVITFHNSHLVYAITWYTLALMVAAAVWLGIRSETRT